MGSFYLTSWNCPTSLVEVQSTVILIFNYCYLITISIKYSIHTNQTNIRANLFPYTSDLNYEWNMINLIKHCVTRSIKPV